MCDISQGESKFGLRFGSGLRRLEAGGVHGWRGAEGGHVIVFVGCGLVCGLVFGWVCRWVLGWVCRGGGRDGTAWGGMCWDGQGSVDIQSVPLITK